MNKPTRNPEYDKQLKIYNSAFGRHQSMGIVSKKITTKEEMLVAFEQMKIEWDKLMEINLFIECTECGVEKSKCIDCIYAFYGK